MRFIIALFLALGWAVITSTNAEEDPSTLREAFQDRFLVGVALDGHLPADYSLQELALVASQFNALTPANCMKMMFVQRWEGGVDFGMADELVEFASKHKLAICGHCLVWAKDERTPSWFFEQDGKAVSRDLLFERMEKHINAVAGRYRGKLVSWDVVNEVLDDGTNYLRPSKWVSIGGEEFLARAFQYAHRADPGAMLILNDYNVELPAKRAKLLRLIRDLQARHAPVHAIGIQGHYELDAVPYEAIDETISAIRQLGLKVMITEFDIDAIPRARWWADGGKHREELARFNPYTNGCPPQVLQRQAEQYARIFAIFKKHSGTIARITFWDLHDGRSWLNHFPWERTNYPLLFDRQARPKPAFRAVVAAAPE